MINMFRDRSGIRKVAMVEDGAAMIPNTFVEMALGLPTVLFAAFFTSNEVSFEIYSLRGHVYVVLFGGGEGVVGLALL